MPRRAMDAVSVFSCQCNTSSNVGPVSKQLIYSWWGSIQRCCRAASPTEIGTTQGASIGRLPGGKFAGNVPRLRGLRR